MPGYTRGDTKYNEVAQRMLEQTGARNVALLIEAGRKGDGFAVQGDLTFILALPERLRYMASNIERRVAKAGAEEIRPFTGSIVAQAGDAVKVL